MRAIVDLLPTTALKKSDFHYDLPAELIAQAPLAERSASRLLLVPPAPDAFTDLQVRDLPSLLQPGDLIVAIDGQRIDSVAQVIGEIQALGRAGGPGMIEVLRGGERLALEVTPRQGKDAKGNPVWQIGVGFPTTYSPSYDTLLRYGPLDAVTVAVRETGRLAADSLGMMARIVTGKASLQNVSGPVTIARVANVSAKRGLDWFLQFLALLSLSLCIINLLPIPILDGGHLLYYLIELVKGSPLSERAIAAGQYIGLALLAGLMGLAFYNDILGLVPR